MAVFKYLQCFDGLQNIEDFEKLSEQLTQPEYSLNNTRNDSHFSIPPTTQKIYLCSSIMTYPFFQFSLKHMLFLSLFFQFCFKYINLCYIYHAYVCFRLITTINTINKLQSTQYAHLKLFLKVSAAVTVSCMRKTQTIQKIRQFYTRSYEPFHRNK